MVRRSAICLCQNSSFLALRCCRCLRSDAPCAWWCCADSRQVRQGVWLHFARGQGSISSIVCSYCVRSSCALPAFICLIRLPCYSDAAQLPRLRARVGVLWCYVLHSRGQPMLIALCGVSAETHAFVGSFSVNAATTIQGLPQPAHIGHQLRRRAAHAPGKEGASFAWPCLTSVRCSLRCLFPVCTAACASSLALLCTLIAAVAVGLLPLC
jgi:hypothetical protein